MEELLKFREVKLIKGILKLYVVVDVVFIRDMSCYCNVCLEGNVCEGWRKEILQISRVKDVDESNFNYMIVLKGKYVVVRYLEKCFIGKVIDEDDIEFEILFMEIKKKNVSG